MFTISTSGPPLSLCGYCRKFIGKTTVLLSISNFQQISEEQQKGQRMSNVSFNSVNYCQCIEKMLIGAIYEQR